MTTTTHIIGILGTPTARTAAATIVHGTLDTRTVSALRTAPSRYADPLQDDIFLHVDPDDLIGLVIIAPMETAIIIDADEQESFPGLVEVIASTDRMVLVDGDVPIIGHTLQGLLRDRADDTATMQHLHDVMTAPMPISLVLVPTTARSWTPTLHFPTAMSQKVLDILSDHVVGVGSDHDSGDTWVALHNVYASTPDEVLHGLGPMLRELHTHQVDPRISIEETTITDGGTS